MPRTARQLVPSVACAFVAAASLHPSSARAQMGPAPVALAPVVEQEMATGRSFVGTLQPIRKSVVGSAVDGRVLEFPVKEGDAVKQGDLLAQLRTKTIEAEVAAAKAELVLREQELAELANGTRPEVIAQKKAAMLAAEARTTYAKKDLDRIQRLYEGQTAANDELDEAISRASETQQEYLGATAAYEEAVTGPRKEVIEQARAQVEQQRQDVERLEDMLAKYSIVAPFDGYVTAQRSEVGEWVMQGQAVAEVIELGVVEVVVPVLEDYVGRLKIGMSAEVTVSSLGGRAFPGTVAYVVPQADPRSRTFPVRVRLKNEEAEGQPLLKAGMFADVMLPVGEAHVALLVPKDALVLSGANRLVHVFTPSENDPKAGTVRPLPVETGASMGPLIEVRGELKAGDMVVVRGNERLMPGQAVTVREILESASGVKPANAVVTGP